MLSRWEKGQVPVDSVNDEMFFEKLSLSDAEKLGEDWYVVGNKLPRPAPAADAGIAAKRLSFGSGCRVRLLDLLVSLYLLFTKVQ